MRCSVAPDDVWRQPRQQEAAASLPRWRRKRLCSRRFPQAGRQTSWRPHAASSRNNMPSRGGSTAHGLQRQCWFPRMALRARSVPASAASTPRPLQPRHSASEVVERVLDDGKRNSKGPGNGCRIWPTYLCTHLTCTRTSPLCLDARPPREEIKHATDAARVRVRQSPTGEWTPCSPSRYRARELMAVRHMAPLAVRIPDGA